MPIANQGTGVFDVEEHTEIAQANPNPSFDTGITNYSGIDGGSVAYNSTDKTLLINNGVSGGFRVSNLNFKNYRYIISLKARRISGTPNATYSYTHQGSLSWIFTLTSEWATYSKIFLSSSERSDGYLAIRFGTSGVIEIDDLYINAVVLPSITTGTKLLKCITAGTYVEHYTGSTSVDASFDYFSGTTWYHYEDTLSNLISTHAWLSLVGEYLTFTLTANQQVANINISNGVKQ